MHDEPQPFGGFGVGGWGRSGSRAALEEFTELRWITIQSKSRYWARSYGARDPAFAAAFSPAVGAAWLADARVTEASYRLNRELEEFFRSI
ncbi:hypothetical protein AB0I77_51970 [Streptomyces sp. NPDC050619]|uniref:hypothetical protein n=1 Tax=Streptomyces sp. NPDC050619 TaxID=3157214 RepID=UPI003441DC08